MMFYTSHVGLNAAREGARIARPTRLPPPTPARTFPVPAALISTAHFHP
jgi:hypothetical protein